MKRLNETENLVTEAEVLEALPTDDEMLEATQTKINDAIDDFIDTSTVVLNDATYSDNIFWQYPLSKDVNVENLRLSFNYLGYYSEDLIVERVGNNQPIRKKVYLGVQDRESSGFLQTRLNYLFNTKNKIICQLEKYKKEFLAEMEGIYENANGEELQIQLNNLFVKLEDTLKGVELELNDQFKYTEWTFNF
jgi:hypothetical protein